MALERILRHILPLVETHEREGVPGPHLVMMLTEA